ncbi:MAG TPA: SIR2 family protein [Thermoanaerobaculia bacterium]|jgi:hypothetical protein|nr:SIR2 family protein [Thermoanaerobaculia bacterium]
MSELTVILAKSPPVSVADDKVLEHASKYVAGELDEKLTQADPWASLSMLWPPRLVGATVGRRLAAFFGAGMSLAAGAPSWSDLLTKYFRLSDDVLQDRELGDDPLTLAQLAAEQVGYERVQQILREVMGSYSKPTTAHVLLAALRLPFYITTNYDTLFEEAWASVFPRHPLSAVIVNDLDLSGGIDISTIIRSGGSILLKIHGCVRRDKEQLILTRRDYRTHYRANEKFFTLVRELLHDYHVLFLGFSHKDPEVSRLVEDVIYDYERDMRRKVTPTPRPPHFYSLQFDMRSHSPEVFAARGILALKPPLVPTTAGDARSTALATALCDLDGSAFYRLHESASLDELMRDCLGQLTTDIDDALATLSTFASEAIDSAQGKRATTWLHDAVTKLGPMAGQGVWLVNEEGVVVDYDLPYGLSKSAREDILKKRATLARRPPPPNGRGWLDDRPYFRSAKTFQDPFVSDVSQSIFNGHGTVFLCQPLIDSGQFRGLLFAATQVGAWSTPVMIAERCLREERQFMLVDSNGVLLVPTVGDHLNNIVPIESNGASGAEDRKANVGFPYSRLLDLSRRDSLVAHIANNIVPVSQDDDILVLSADLKQYSVIAEVPRSRLKLAVTRGIR